MRTVSQSVGGSYVIKQGCVQQEEQARDQLSGMPDVPPRIHNWCEQVATQRTGSRGSYQIYLSCVLQEVAAAE